MKKHLLLTLFTFFATIWLSGQTLRQYEKAVDEAFAKKDYYAALYYLDIIQEIDSTIIDLQYKQAEAARNFNAYLLAEKRYEQVLASEQAKDFPLSSYWLGHIYKNLGNYQKAQNSFRYYVDSIPIADSTYVADAKNEIESCQWALQVQGQYDEDVQITQLGAEVNTPYSEFGPYEKDGKLYFSSLRFPESKTKTGPPKLYSKVLQSSNNGPNEIVDLDANNQVHTAHNAFSKNGDRFYFNICNYTDGNIISCALYYKEVTATGFGTTQKLSANVNVEGYTVTQPSIGYNKESGKETLYFVSDRPNGKGGLDIWYCDIDEDGALGKAKNFELVNTNKDEAAPFFHTNTRVFYFSSKGRENLGGYDLFRVYIDDGITWETIEHVEMPLNTSYDDIYFTLTDYGDEGYFASNREGSLILEKEISACCNDIFKLKLLAYHLDLTALTFNGEKDNTGTNNPLTDVEVSLYDMSSGAPVEVPFKRLPNGHKHYYRVKSGKDYMLIGKKEHFLADTILFNTSDIAPGEKISKKLFLNPLGLDVFVYTAEEEELLKKAKVQVFELDDKGNKIRELAMASSKAYQYRMEEGKRYKIYADAIGYQPDSLAFDTYTWTGGPVLVKKLYLPLDPPEEVIFEEPDEFPLFFDNDSPDPRTLATTTKKTYPITLEEYERKKELYKKGYTKGLTGEEKIMAEWEVETFFETEVKKSYLAFEEFTQEVLERLLLGNRYIITVKAYSSPLAKADYNYRLSQRRISSMENYYRQYRGGMMARFVNDGSIRFKLEAYGEDEAPTSISDNPRDRKNSVYSPTASRERRVVIIGVERENTDNGSSRTEVSSDAN